MTDNALMNLVPGIWEYTMPSFKEQCMLSPGWMLCYFSRELRYSATWIILSAIIRLAERRFRPFNIHNFPAPCCLLVFTDMKRKEDSCVSLRLQSNQLHNLFQCIMSDSKSLESAENPDCIHSETQLPLWTPTIKHLHCGLFVRKNRPHLDSSKFRACLHKQ